MCPKSYKSQRIISYLGSQLWMFLSQNTVSSLAFFPTLQIYSTCSLAHHGTIPDSMSTDIFFDLPEPNPTMGHPPSAFPTSPTVYEAQLLEDQSVWGLAQWKFRCHNVITSSCCLLLLCWGILLSVILTVAIWRTSVFKLPSSLSTDHQTTYLNSSSSFFFFYQDDPIQYVWASSIELIFHSNNLSLHLFLCSYFHIQRRDSLSVS